MTSAIRNTSRRAAFTLIELLIVVGVIVLLASITLAVGPRVLEARKEATTEQIITALDGMLETYITERQGTIPPDINNDFVGLWQDIDEGPENSDLERIRAFYGDTNYLEDPTMEDIVPVYRDPSTNKDYSIRPSSAMFLYQTQGIGNIDSALAQMPASRLTQVFGEDSESAFSLTAVLDAWGHASRPYERHILYVHPANQRAQQLYGYCQNNRPYFLSAGADGIYGSIHDLSFARRDQLNLGRPPFDSNERVVEFFRKALEDNITSYEVRPAIIGNDANLQKHPEEQ